ncbi:MAG: SGNH/GDSL hydrolase family protein [Candidatus Eiseniibacteriota bacterium]
MVPARFERYVAIGDSSTEGLDDPDGHGGYRGWSRRLAERLRTAQGALEYHNFGIRGLKTRQIRDRQLERALNLRPDLATLFCGTNDLMTLRFDARAVGEDAALMQRELIARGATVLTFTLPDLSPVMPLARLIAPRVRALNAALRDAAAGSGAFLLDFAAHRVAADPRLWSDDRIHANSDGHARIAEALAHALGLAGATDAWQRPLAPTAPASWSARARAELSWMHRHLLPWARRGMGGR